MLLTGLLCGILLGFVMQRGRFCITGAFRDMYVTKNNKMFVALYWRLPCNPLVSFS